MATKLIIFDFWGTLVENGVRPSPSKQIRYFLRLREPFSEFIIKFEEAFMTRKYENLKQGFEAVVEAFDKRIPDFVYDKMVGMWNKSAILAKPYEETVEALTDLKKDYKIALLSNTDPFSIPQVLDKFDLDKLFDKQYLSFEMGMLKSDKHTYEQIMEDFGVTPEECLMVGDSPQSDLASARNADVPAVLIDRRDWSEEEEKIASLKDLREYIESKE